MLGHILFVFRFLKLRLVSDDYWNSSSEYLNIIDIKQEKIHMTSTGVQNKRSFLLLNDWRLKVIPLTILKRE